MQNKNGRNNEFVCKKIGKLNIEILASHLYTVKMLRQICLTGRCVLAR